MRKFVWGKEDFKRTGPAFNQMKGRSLVSNVVTGNGGRSEMRLTRGGHSLPLNRPACLVVSGNAADLSLHEDYERRAKALLNKYCIDSLKPRLHNGPFVR